MELKRYVMDGKKYIIDLKDNRYSIRFNGEIHFNKGNKIVKIGNVAKTSDNILDLVEVGDLVGYRFLGEDYEHIDKMHDEQNIADGIKHNGLGFVITAIYKRQSNGDYKKYEVKV